MPEDGRDGVLIDFSHSWRAREAAIEHLQRTSDGRIALDLRGREWLNSADIADMLRIRKAAEGNGQKVDIIGVNTGVWNVFLVTGLDKLFAFHDDIPARLEPLRMDVRDVPPVSHVNKSGEIARAPSENQPVANKSREVPRTPTPGPSEKLLIWFSDWVPRDWREGFVGDLHEYIAEWRAHGMTERKIRRRVIWQLLIGIAQRPIVWKGAIVAWFASKLKLLIGG